MTKRSVSPVSAEKALCRTTASSTESATAVSSGSLTAASLNAPSAANPAPIAGSPLPWTSPMITRVPWGDCTTS